MDENKLDYILYIYIYTHTRLYTRLCLIKAMVFPVVMYHVGVLL